MPKKVLNIVTGGASGAIGSLMHGGGLKGALGSVATGGVMGAGGRAAGPPPMMGAPPTASPSFGYALKEAMMGRGGGGVDPRTGSSAFQWHSSLAAPKPLPGGAPPSPDAAAPQGGPDPDLIAAMQAAKRERGGY